ncbi:MAG: RnfABCDGE type electron transport complex subunit B [Deferribacteraceae bacterium]|jgi:Na+-translocating ferredoxin:NAD+ oxidoreductase RNF subunit RnfB|nr:RnfABCDGE type electron transport complex subunit B [Deferribacteraceae bacterium]
MIEAIILLAILGGAAGAGLAVASKKFSVAKDPKYTAVLENLPGTNCGACGFPGCAGMASAIIDGKATPTSCPVNTGEGAKAIGAIMGIEVHESVRLVARVLCGGDREASVSSAEYRGITDCNVMAATSGGGKACVYGCMGGGTCVKACAYGAMRMGDNGLPIVDESMCVSCGLCVKACPRNIMKLLPVDNTVYVACSTRDKGADVRKICQKGCISCKMCQKVCPKAAIDFYDNILAVIDPSLCDNMGGCAMKCPTKAIRMKKS